MGRAAERELHRTCCASENRGESNLKSKELNIRSTHKVSPKKRGPRALGSQCRFLALTPDLRMQPATQMLLGFNGGYRLKIRDFQGFNRLGLVGFSAHDPTSEAHAVYQKLNALQAMPCTS